MVWMRKGMGYVWEMNTCVHLTYRYFGVLSQEKYSVYLRFDRGIDIYSIRNACKFVCQSHAFECRKLDVQIPIWTSDFLSVQIDWYDPISIQWTQWIESLIRFAHMVNDQSLTLCNIYRLLIYIWIKRTVPYFTLMFEDSFCALLIYCLLEMDWNSLKSHWNSYVILWRMNILNRFFLSKCSLVFVLIRFNGNLSFMGFSRTW